MHKENLSSRPPCAHCAECVLTEPELPRPYSLYATASCVQPGLGLPAIRLRLPWLLADTDGCGQEWGMPCNRKKLIALASAWPLHAGAFNRCRVGGDPPPDRPRTEAKTPSLSKLLYASSAPGSAAGPGDMSADLEPSDRIRPLEHGRALLQLSCRMTNKRCLGITPTANAPARPLLRRGPERPVPPHGTGPQLPYRAIVVWIGVRLRN